MLDEASFKHWQARVQGAFERLEEAHGTSALPDEPRNIEALERWLIDVRLRELRR